jgi:hypothetical protein
MTTKVVRNAAKPARHVMRVHLEVAGAALCKSQTPMYSERKLTRERADVTCGRCLAWFKREGKSGA